MHKNLTVILMPGLLALLLAGAFFTGGCARRPPASADQTASLGSPVVVLYAGSLVNLMEHDLGPAFQQASGYSFRGVAGGALALANQIKGKLRRADVFISASPKVNDTLVGDANGNWVQWYVTYAEAPLVIGYNPKSQFAKDLATKPWYEVLAEPGFRLGRTDPVLDPKGALTIQLLDQASQYYHRPGLMTQLLGPPDNPAQVFPEEELVGRLQAGQLDAGFFYSNEATEQHMPYITLPDAIVMKARYTVTILRDAPDQPGALAFVQFLLGPQGQAILRQHGLTVLKPTLTGNAAVVPDALRPLISP